MIIKQKKVYMVNPDCDILRLQEIARVNNARLAAGEETTLTLGHTSDADPELITIPVGHAENFMCMGDSLYCDLVIDDEWANQITKYNKVSCELWADNVITPIALLAKNRPALEVGLIKYDMPNRGDLEHKPYITEEEQIEVENISPQEIQQLFIETMNHSEVFGKFTDLMENIIPKLQETVKHMEDTLAPLLAEEVEEHPDLAGQLEGEEEAVGEVPAETAEEAPEKVEGEGDGKDPAEENALVEEEKEHPELPEQTVEKIVEDHEKEGKVEDKPKEEVEKNDAMASANDGYIAGLENEKKKVKKYQMDLIKATEEKNELVKKYQLELRKNELNDLSKTYFFDPKDEVEIVTNMDDEQWEMHKKIIKTKYQKAPVGRVVSVAADVEDRNVKSPDKVQRAIKVALDKGISFKEALDAV